MLTIVDYGSGNLRSVQKAFERIGAEARITADPDVVGGAEALVLPGVGAFGDAMAALHARRLVDPLQAHLRADRPFLGICMGLQLLFDVGWEGGQHHGLGALAGDVVRFDLPPGHKVPHMGWNTVNWQSAAGPLASAAAAHFYFVHAYHARPADPTIIAGITEYGGPFCSAIVRGRLWATQFHPEKSQADGLQLLAGFLTIL